MTALIFVLIFLGAVPPALASEDARKLIALVDYLGADYKNAVRARKIVNVQEYQEMKEFSRQALVQLGRLKAEKGRDLSAIEANVHRLSGLIEKKEDAKAVAELAGEIREKLLVAYGIVPYPRRLPSFQAGKAVYLQNCAQCHGDTGRGDGPARQSMQPKEPPPANFTDPDLLAGLSPFKAFNTLSFGIEGTAMASFSALSEDELWQAAFYLFSLRFSQRAAEKGKALFKARGLPVELTSVSLLATTSDEGLRQKLEPHLSNPDEQLTLLAYLRSGILQEGAPAPLIAARALLDEAYSLYEKGEREKAYQKAVEAYLNGFELAEPELLTRDAALARALERRFASFRTSLRRGDDLATVRKLHVEIRADLARTEEILSAEEELPGGYAFFSAFVIILREGLEAALILAAILALLKQIGAGRAALYIHLGWALALLAGLLTWFLAQTVLTLGGSQREGLEGLTTIAAAVVLFYAGYWLHTRTEAQRWQKFIADKVQKALSGRSLAALIGISFFAVYREAFEVVLFYQALWLRSSSAGPVVWGFIAGAGCLVVVVFALRRFTVKIPLRHFFRLTGALLFILALVFAGQGVKELQTAGWISVTPLEFLPQVDPLGIYPTVETLAAQGLMLLGLLTSALRFGRREGSH